jgi:hypothetical protein
VVHVEDVEAEDLEGHVLQRLDVMKNASAKRKKKTASEVRTARVTSRLR